MKELCIEEKAKHYDEALHKAKRIINVCVDGNTECRSMIACIQQIFPELKESEDERIKEWLINLAKGHIEWLEDRIREQLSNGQVYGGELVKAKNSLAWLERQGEHANFRNKIQIGDKVTRNEDGVLVNLSQLNRVAKKQGEQKPTWKPSDEQMEFVWKYAEQNNYDGKVFARLYNDLKKLKGK